MVDVKTCLDNAQEKMDMAVMYLRRSIGTYPRWKSEYPTVGWYPRDSYGSMVPISNVAALSTRMLAVSPSN